MCDEGKAPHYSGEKIRQASLSRYELAAVVIDLSENENALTPDEKESLKKIRQSYSRELEARNWKEEKSPDQAEIHGDLRIRKTRWERPADGRARIGILYHIGQHAEAGAEEIKITIKMTLNHKNHRSPVLDEAGICDFYILCILHIKKNAEV